MVIQISEGNIARPLAISRFGSTNFVFIDRNSNTYSRDNVAINEESMARYFALAPSSVTVSSDYILVQQGDPAGEILGTLQWYNANPKNSARRAVLNRLDLS